MDDNLRWQKVTFWIRKEDGKVVWCFDAQGVIGPDEALHVVLSPSDFLELTAFVNDLAEGIHEMDTDYEPPSHREEGTK